MQNNQVVESDSWENLIGYYTHVLLDDNYVMPQKFNPNSHIRDVAPIDSYNGSTRGFSSTGAIGLNQEHNVGCVSQDEKFLNRNTTSVVPYSQNVGGYVHPRKVNSFEELMGMTKTVNASLGNGDRSHSLLERTRIIGPDYQVDGSGSVMPMSRDVGGCNLQKLPNGKLSFNYRPNYKLNLPPGSEAGESSTAGRAFQLAPVTPDQQKHLKKNHQTVQVPHLWTDEISAQENNKQENIILPQQPEIVDNERNNFLNINSTPTKEKKSSDGTTDGGIDLNKTPQQKPPKRKKLRPRVVVEGKPKRTPKPKHNTPHGNSTQKRKYERRNGIKTSENLSPEGCSAKRRKYERRKGVKTSEDQSTDAAYEVKVSNVEPEEKSCSRALHFDLENEIDKSCKDSKVPFDQNLDYYNAEWSTELNEQSRKEQKPEASYNLIPSAKQVLPQESLSASLTTSNDHALNVIARSLNVRNAKGGERGVRSTYNQIHHSISRGTAHHEGNGTSSSMVSATKAVEGFSGHFESIGSTSFGAQSYELHLHGGLSSNHREEKSSSINSNNVLQHETINLKGSLEDKNIMFSVDCTMERLNDRMDSNSRERVGEDTSAIVPYRIDGAVVPYEAIDPIKKRQARPKVDLDPETNRLWDLLMGKEGSERAEKMNNDKEQWWEDERKVFRGRVDTFIARMHLVQGDRRFSKWKGSVVDSVIGVFLTQNVSDHLSSSAFMSLAAKFPIKSTTDGESCSQNKGTSSKEQGVIIRYPDGTSYEHRTIREPVYNGSSVTSSKLSEYGSEHVTSGKKILANNHREKTEESMNLSQSLSESITHRASADIRSGSGSNTEAEDQITGSNFSKNQYQIQVMGNLFPEKRRETSTSHQQSENPAHYPLTTNVLHYQRPVPPSVSSWQKMLTVPEEWEEASLAFLGKESMSSLASTNIEINNGIGVEQAHDKAGPSAVSSLTAQKIEKPVFQPSRLNHEIANKHLEQKTDFPARSGGKDGLNSIHFRQGVEETCQQENTFGRDPIRPSEEFSTQQSDADIPFSKNGTSQNARKGKAEKTKAEPFNWDALRMQVESKDGTRGRSRDRMDSLDYEALQNADVLEISDVIKERGMHKMLAGRIKEFLDRLVRDHGRMDLEWLRDVQPDKAKEYLLSIQGLGLKSTECVRLLTLHHLAFPVDTNVGRIAVRLGWVPLQPLPESLQLHLLELYPVLDSVQKYLWPRLCKLDQETLYELHYQMITFGKVFCTKRDPNCNACPLRAECRHFASAFASARLALPGTEERRIVTSVAPTWSNRSADVVIRPMTILPLADDNLDIDTGFMRNFEPIIEEPKTPESPIEVLERDIEDAFSEDPNEIPEIKLNVDEFTTNLQSFIQEDIEMQEGDMAKALVALSPVLTSIQGPKLKHISRLRTEHQVYELPDSHTLLKGMERREPDDPSPYLLAIWTPRETADSSHPPESKCSCHEGVTLCNKKTCFSCNSTRETQTQTVRGTILIPCRTAMRGSFPLNGTYFQVNEVFADHESSINPIDVPRNLIWNLPRRTVYFGTSVSTICRGLSTEAIQYSFWKGFVCVRGFDWKTRGPKPLLARLHLPASKMPKKTEKK